MPLASIGAIATQSPTLGAIATQPHAPFIFQLGGVPMNTRTHTAHQTHKQPRQPAIVGPTKAQKTIQPSRRPSLTIQWVTHNT